MADLNTVMLSPEGTYHRRERLAGAAGILPGYVLDLNASNEVIPYAAAEAKPPLLRFATISIGDAGDISREYADGETVHYVEAAAGCKVAVVVAGSQTIVKGDEITTAANGLVKKPAVAGEGVWGTSNGEVTTGVGETTFLSVTINNF